MDKTAEFDFSELPDAAVSSEDSPSLDRTPDEKICPICDLPIVRDPSWKRMRKYHDECKPSTTQQVRDAVSGTTPRRNTKAEQEADLCVVMLKKHMVRGAMGAMLIDQYDGFVIMTAIPGICENIRGILIRKEKWRKEVLALQTGGSIIGLVIAIIMVALPILAHHGLVPQSKLRQMLHDMPVVLFKISQRMKQGEQAMNEMMERVAAEALKPEKPKEGDGNNTVPPTNVYPFAPTGTAP